MKQKGKKIKINLTGENFHYVLLISHMFSELEISHRATYKRITND